MRDALPVASQAVRITIENRRLLRCRLVFWPVPILRNNQLRSWTTSETWYLGNSGPDTYRLVAGVATLISKGFLVGIDKPTVPGQEIAREMNCKRLLDMSHDEVVKLEHAIDCVNTG